MDFQCVIDINAYKLDNKIIKSYMINIYYKFIIKRNYPLFWDKVGGNTDEKFRKLFVKMIDVNPLKRPDIDDILKDPFLEEINTKNKKEIEDLETEISDKFKEIENDYAGKNTTEIVNNNKTKNENNSESRDISRGEKKYFALGLKPEIFKKGMYLEYYIKIKGKLDPSNYMNSFIKIVKLTIKI